MRIDHPLWTTDTTRELLPALDEKMDSLRVCSVLIERGDRLSTGFSLFGEIPWRRQEDGTTRKINRHTGNNSVNIVRRSERYRVADSAAICALQSITIASVASVFVLCRVSEDLQRRWSAPVAFDSAVRRGIRCGPASAKTPALVIGCVSTSSP